MNFAGEASRFDARFLAEEVLETTARKGSASFLAIGEDEAGLVVIVG